MKLFKRIVAEAADLTVALAILAAMGYVSLVILRFAYRFITG